MTNKFMFTITPKIVMDNRLNANLILNRIPKSIKLTIRIR
jgi:hypothetical protein